MAANIAADGGGEEEIKVEINFEEEVSKISKFHENLKVRDDDSGLEDSDSEDSEDDYESDDSAKATLWKGKGVEQNGLDVCVQTKAKLCTECHSKILHR